MSKRVKTVRVFNKDLEPLSLASWVLRKLANPVTAVEVPGWMDRDGEDKLTTAALFLERVVDRACGLRPRRRKEK